MKNEETVTAELVEQPEKKPRKKQVRKMTMASPVDSSLQIVIASELADDELIEAEITGKASNTFIYSFKQDGKEVKNLSAKGVNEVVRRINKDIKSGSKIRLNPAMMKFEEVEEGGQKGIVCTVFAEDIITGNNAFGVKFEPYMSIKSDGKTTYRNKFCREKALSKAERNAKLKLIPEQLCISIIEKIIAEMPSTVKAIDVKQYQVETVKPVAPVKTPEVDIEEKIRRSVSNPKKSSTEILDINKKVQSSNSFGVEFKKEIQEIVDMRLTDVSYEETS